MGTEANTWGSHREVSQERQGGCMDRWATDGDVESSWQCAAFHCISSHLFRAVMHREVNGGESERPAPDADLVYPCVSICTRQSDTVK